MPKVLKNIVFLLIFAFVGIAISAQSSQKQPSAQMLAASEIFRAQKWEEAAMAYETLLKDEPNNGSAWYQLGISRYSLKQYAAASEAFLKNIAISNSGFTMFNSACVYSLMNEKDKAIEWLGKTIDNPRMVLPALDLKATFDSRLYQKKWTDKFVRACIVARPNILISGSENGTYIIRRPAMMGRASYKVFPTAAGYWKNWTNSFNGGGKSINFYDSNDHKWYQYWIGSAGGPGRWSGVYRDGAIRFENETVNTSGKKTLGRLTFFNVDANTVRQFAENSVDDGKRNNLDKRTVFLPKGPVKISRHPSLPRVGSLVFFITAYKL